MDNVRISPLKENGTGEAVQDSKKKANLLSEHFKSVFTQEGLENLPSLSLKPLPTFLHYFMTPPELLSC